jgi:PAS domain S-box-containing protein
MIIKEILYNLTLLVSISIISGFIENFWKKTSFQGRIIQGILFGATAVIGMVFPFVFSPGFIFDGRSVILSLCALFFGPTSAIIAMVIALIYRVYVGGGGAIMGVSVILTSTLIGLIAFYFRKKFQYKVTVLFLFTIGLIVHVVMILLMYSLPSSNRGEIFNALSLTIIIIYPLSTILIGKILSEQDEKFNLIEKLVRDDRNTSITLLSIADGVITSDKAGCVTRINRMAETLTGWKYEDAKGLPLQTILPLFDPVSRKEISPSNTQEDSVLRGETSEPKLLLNKYGKEYIIQEKTSIITDDRNNEIGKIIVFSDITEKKNSEMQLSFEKNLLRKVIDSLPFSLYVKDIRLKKVLANKKELEYMNLPEEKVIGCDDFALYPAELALGFQKDDLQVIKKGEPVFDKIEFLPLPNNSIRWLSTTKVPWHDEIGNIIGMIGFGMDITDKIESQQKINLLSKAIEQSPTSITITNKDGKIEYVNPHFSTITGYNGEDVLETTAKILDPLYTDRKTYEEIWNILTSGQIWKGEHESTRQNGENFWESVVISPIFNTENIISNYILITEDITDRKEIIKELIDAKKKAEQSDKLKTAFLANMSHEIRTPMNGILGFTDLLRTPGLSKEEQKTFLNIIQQSGERLLNLINDIIDISKIETGEIVLSLEKTNINQLITEIHNFFSPEAIEKGLNLNFNKNLPDKEAFIFTDKNRLYQILSNLIKNSLKFTQKGDIEFGYEHKGEFFEFYVQDTGIGISKEMQQKIFERFHQGDLILTKRYEGSGLGLSICKAFVEMLGGSIGVESNTDKNNIEKGSRFYFTLPEKTSLGQ